MIMRYDADHTVAAHPKGIRADNSVRVAQADIRGCLLKEGHNVVVQCWKEESKDLWNDALLCSQLGLNCLHKHDFCLMQNLLEAKSSFRPLIMHTCGVSY